ncbi:MSC_0621 family F1-like ATPase epsilon subunit [Mycoplasma corogypsi]|uniref:MSC_0621 family F1-like ATPase epsilon subunit n=1 Tax=Mycoplasma corogypsi TaxID=2106 RepID=UPI003873277D
MSKAIKLQLVDQLLVKKELYIEQLSINVGLENTFVPFVENAIGSFKKLFARVKSKDNKTFYLIVDTALLTYIQDQITIKYNGNLNTYVIDSSPKNNLKLVDDKLKEYYQEISLIKAQTNLSLMFKNDTRIELLEEKMFQLKAISNFALKQVEVKWNSNEND